MGDVDTKHAEDLYELSFIEEEAVNCADEMAKFHFLLNQLGAEDNERVRDRIALHIAAARFRYGDNKVNRTKAVHDIASSSTNQSFEIEHLDFPDLDFKIYGEKGFLDLIFLRIIKDRVRARARNARLIIEPSASPELQVSVLHTPVSPPRGSVALRV